MRNSGPLAMGRSRLDDDDINTKRMQLHMQGVAKTFNRKFGGVIPTPEGFAELCAYGGDIDDPTGTLRPHRWQHELGQAGEAE